MKLLGLLMLVFSFQAQASQAQTSFNEFECEFRDGRGNSVSLDIERPFGGSNQRNATMSVAKNGQVEMYNFFVFMRPLGMNEIRYTGADFELRIDVWPDTRPQWGRTYRADFRTWTLGDQSNYYNIDCRYTRI